MYYTTSGAYRKTKMIIDYANIVLTVCISVLFVLILFFGKNSGILFPLIFFAGAVMNGNCGVKKLMDRQKVSGIITLIAAAVFLIMAVLCLLAVI